MSNPILKYKANVNKEKNLGIIRYGKKINKDLLIAVKNDNHKMILFDFKLKKKTLDISFHNSYISSIHICKKPLYINNKEITFTTNSFYFLSSSNDEKFALHEISYNDLSSDYSNYKLIAKSRPTKDELNGVIQIENGQILVAARDQTVILFDNKIQNGKFVQLFKVKKKWAMEPTSLFEIKNNLIGVPWKYDDAEADYTIAERKNIHKYHKNDGIYIYLISGNKMIEKNRLRYKGFGRGLRHKSYFVVEDKLILVTFGNIFVYNLNNFEIIFKLSSNDFIPWNIYPFNEKHFIVFKNEGTKAKFILYNINTMKDVQTIEVVTQGNEFNLFPISNNEYIFNNLIITIDEA